MWGGLPFLMNINIDKALAIEGWMLPTELAWLAEKASKAQIGIEIGSWMGRSTRAIGDHIQGTLFSIDNWRGLRRSKHHRSKRLYFNNLHDLLGSGKIVSIEHNSQLGIPHLLKDHQADFLFIDGDHSYDGCLSDITHFSSIVRSGGIISGHDYDHPKHPGVRQAVHHAFGDYINLHDTIWWTIKA